MFYEKNIKTSKMYDFIWLTFWDFVYKKRLHTVASVATTLELFLSNPLIRIINQNPRETTFIGKQLNI